MSPSASGSASSARTGRGEVVAERRRPGRARARSRPRAPRACGRGRRGGGTGSGPRRAARRARAARTATRPSASMCARPSSAASPATIRFSSAKIRSGETRSSPAAWARAASAVAGVDREPELAGQPREPERAQRVRGERLRATPSAAAARRGPSRPPWGSTSSPPASGSAIALTVRSRAREVGRERPALQRRDVDLPRLARGRRRASRRTRRRARTPPRPPRARCAARRRARIVRRRRGRRPRRRRRGRAGGRAPRRRRPTRARRRSASRTASITRSGTPVAVVRARDAPAEAARDLVVDRVQAARPTPRRGSARRPARRSAPRRRRGPTSGSPGPSSIVTLSMLTVPRSGRRRPPTSTSALFGQRRGARRRRSRSGPSRASSAPRATNRRP